MSPSLLKELPELVEAGVIDHETEARIRQHYSQKAPETPKLFLIIIGILGAILVGLGIILVIAHNWDQFSKFVRLLFALLPLFLGQLACAYTLWKRSESVAWREGSAAFLFFSVATAIAIVSQVYNIPGDLPSFLLTWLALAIPIIYCMRSVATSLLTIATMTWYVLLESYFQYPTEVAWPYWLLLVAAIPFYISLWRQKKKNAFHAHSWMIAASVVIAFGMFAKTEEEIMFIGYMSLFSTLVMLGSAKIYAEEKLRTNAFLIAGSLGIVIELLILSFDFFWEDVLKSALTSGDEFIASTVVSVGATVLLLLTLRNKYWSAPNPKSFVFLAFIAVFFIGLQFPKVAQTLINLLLLFMAIVTAKRGADEDRFAILNYGLAIFSALVLCRFFDTDMSFIVRGLLFISVGLCFFGANYWMLKRRKNKLA